ncbi:MAG: hypothetical protein Q8L29_03830 [archaeon]|nr:hypothetical protein [archaeon]
MVKKKPYTTRELARYASRHFVPGDTTHIEDCTYDIAFADTLMKKGEYNEAMKALEYAGSFELPYLPEENKSKVAQAIVNRAYRIAKKGKSSQSGIHLEDRASKLEKTLHNRYLDKERRHLKSTLAAAIISISAGLLLISSTITGSTITNLDSTSSSIIGTILVAVGLIGGFYWLKKN